MRASACLTASRPRAASTIGAAQRATTAPRVVLSAMPTTSSSQRCRRKDRTTIIAFTASSAPASALPRRRFPLIATRASPSEQPRDNAVLKGIVEAAAAAAKAAREASASSSSSSSGVSPVSSSSASSTSSTPSSDEASSSGLRGATVSPRRTRMITFTCNKCDSRTERQINPTAWDKGLVFVQCGTCEAWHKVSDAMGLIEEVIFEKNDEPSALVKKSSSFDSSSSPFSPSPELSFEAADEPHGLVAIEGDDESEKKV